jgi:hypothetical protein
MRNEFCVSLLKYRLRKSTHILMKILKVVGFFLIVAGIVMIGTRTFSFKTKEKVLDTNTVDISIKETKTITWPWFAGIFAVAGGISIVLISGKKENKSSTRNSVHF